MQTLENLGARTPTLSTQKLLRIIESLEPVSTAECDSILIEPQPQDLLLIDREDSAG